MQNDDKQKFIELTRQISKKQSEYQEKIKLLKQELNNDLKMFKKELNIIKKRLVKLFNKENNYKENTFIINEINNIDL